MSQPASYPLRLPLSLKEAVAEAAKRDGISINQFITLAVADKLAVLDTIGFFEERIDRADREHFRLILNRCGGEPPREGDEMADSPVAE